MIDTMIPSQVGMRLRSKIKNKPKSPKRKKENKKMREKERRAMLLSFSTLVLQNSTMFFMIESLLFCHFHILLVGIFHYRSWLLYSNDGLPQMLEVFMSKQVGCTPT